MLSNRRGAPGTLVQQSAQTLHDGIQRFSLAPHFAGSLRVLLRVGGRRLRDLLHLPDAGGNLFDPAGLLLAGRADLLDCVFMLLESVAAFSMACTTSARLALPARDRSMDS